MLKITQIFKFKNKSKNMTDSNPQVESSSTPNPLDIQPLKAEEIPTVDLNESDLLQVCKIFCQRLAQTNQDNRFLQKQWQNYYDKLSVSQKEIIWRHANDNLPDLEDIQNPRLINLLWSRVFHGGHIVQKLASNSVVQTKKGFGLIYCYLINGKVRYIGQTRENNLYWRMTEKQEDGKVGYNDSIRRNLLNAYRRGYLSIQTKLVPLYHLEHYKKGLIEYYAPTNHLWNTDHNQYFDKGNYDIVI